MPLSMRPALTGAPSFRNMTYLQGLSSVGLLGYHLHELADQRLGHDHQPAAAFSFSRRDRARLVVF